MLSETISFLVIFQLNFHHHPHTPHTTGAAVLFQYSLHFSTTNRQSHNRAICFLSLFCAANTKPNHSEFKKQPPSFSHGIVVEIGLMMTLFCPTLHQTISCLFSLFPILSLKALGLHLKRKKREQKRNSCLFADLLPIIVIMKVKWNRFSSFVVKLASFS